MGTFGRRCAFALALVGMSGLAPASAATAVGTIKVTVKYKGTPPKSKRIKTKTDPFCKKAKVRYTPVRAKKGLLEGAVVRIDGAVPGTHSVPKETIEINQDGCQYEPRVSVGMVGQSIRIHNLDRTLHNVHSYRKSSTWFNLAQPAKAKPIVRVIKNEKAIKLACDVHPWMKGWVIVDEHPFHGVTDASGVVTLTGVPAREGAYTIAVWHEELGKKTVSVTVASGKTSEATVTFAAEAGE